MFSVRVWTNGPVFVFHVALRMCDAWFSDKYSINQTKKKVGIHCLLVWTFLVWFWSILSVGQAGSVDQIWKWLKVKAGRIWNWAHLAWWGWVFCLIWSTPDESSRDWVVSWDCRCVWNLLASMLLYWWAVVLSSCNSSLVEVSFLEHKANRYISERLLHPWGRVAPILLSDSSTLTANSSRWWRIRAMLKTPFESFKRILKTHFQKKL